MNNHINDKKYIPLTPFKGWVLENFPFIEADFDAITNYELLCKIVEYLNKMSSQFNDIINNLNYLNNWFNNLDVQDEINNKLDEMVEDGTLEQIIEQFINSSALWCFDTVAEMKTATNLIKGSYARTLGFYAKGDGGESLYYIIDEEENNKHQEELENGLYATLIVENNQLDVKQLGATTNNDIGTYITEALSLCKNVNITDTYTINDRWTITGVNNFNITGNLEEMDGTGGIDITNCADFTLNNLYIRDTTTHIESFNNIGLNLAGTNHRFKINKCHFRGQTICCKTNDYTYARFEDCTFEAKVGNTTNCFETSKVFCEMLYFDNCQFEGGYQQNYQGNLVEIKSAIWTRFNNCDFTNASTLIYLNDQHGDTRDIQFNGCHFNHYVYAIRYGNRGIDSVQLNHCGFTTDTTFTALTLIENYHGAGLTFNNCYHKSGYAYGLVTCANTNAAATLSGTFSYFDYFGDMTVTDPNDYLTLYLDAQYSARSSGTTATYLQINSIGNYIPVYIVTDDTSYDYSFKLYGTKPASETYRVYFAEAGASSNKKYQIRLIRIK